MIKNFNLDSGIEYTLIPYNINKVKIKSIVAQGLNAPNIISIINFNDDTNTIFRLTTQFGTQNGFILNKPFLFANELKVIINASEPTIVNLLLQWDL